MGLKEGVYVWGGEGGSLQYFLTGRVGGVCVCVYVYMLRKTHTLKNQEREYRRRKVEGHLSDVI